MTRRLLLLGLLVTTPTLAGCGRQGPLRLPEEAAPAADTEDNRS